MDDTEEAKQKMVVKLSQHLHYYKKRTYLTELFYLIVIISYF